MDASLIIGQYFASDDVYEHNTILELSCSAGTLEGPAVTACQNGTWSPATESLQCKRKLYSGRVGHSDLVWKARSCLAEDSKPILIVRVNLTIKVLIIRTLADRANLVHLYPHMGLTL